MGNHRKGGPSKPPPNGPAIAGHDCVGSSRTSTTTTARTFHSDRDLAGTLGVHEFLDLDGDHLEDAGEVDVVLDVVGGEVRDRSTTLMRPGGTLVTVADPPATEPRDRRQSSSSSSPTANSWRSWPRVSAMGGSHPSSRPSAT